MKKKSLERLLFSIGGVIVMFLLLIAVNMISANLYLRRDVSEDQLYALSAGSKEILRGMDAQVEIRFYFSKDVASMPMLYKSYARQVEDMLNEYKLVSGDKLKVVKLNPTPDSEAEESAGLDGIQGQALGPYERIYLGVAVSCLGETVTLPFLSPARENLLEYDLTRAICQALQPQKPVLGVMTTLPMLGEPVNPMMPPQMRQRGAEKWWLIKELEQNFEIRPIAIDAEMIDPDLDVLMLVHPTNLSETTEYALDQYVLGGGRLLAFLDPMCYIEAQNRPSMNPMQPTQPGVSTFRRLLPAWGISFDTSKVVADRKYRVQIPGPDGQPQDQYAVLALNKAAVSATDPAVSPVASLLKVFAGSFGGTPAEGLQREVLVSSSSDVQLVEKFMAQMPGDHIRREFVSVEQPLALAIRLSGTFQTAFPNGLADADDDQPQSAAGLQRSARPGVVVLVGDADMLYDEFCLVRQRIFGQEIVQMRNENLTLAQNLVEQLAGDSRLLQIRGRTRTERSLEKIRQIQLQAERRYQDKLRELEDKLASARQRLHELQRQRSDDQRTVISPEQRAEIARFKNDEAQINAELKDLRRELRRDIDRLETRHKAANIALIPILVILGGIGVAFAKHRRSVRK